MIHLPFIILIVVAAIWRFLDGMDKKDSRLPTPVRNLGTALLALTGAYLSLGLTWQAGWAAAMATTSIVVGCTKWEDPVWQAIRFGGPALAAVFPLGPSVASGGYVLACILAGVSYTALGKIDHKLPRWKWFSGFEAYARLPLGAAVIGGLACL